MHYLKVNSVFIGSRGIVSIRRAATYSSNLLGVVPINKSILQFFIKNSPSVIPSSVLIPAFYGRPHPGCIDSNEHVKAGRPNNHRGITRGNSRRVVNVG